jgi:2-C-methyl-D-erythritol 2,4-cyclodiphosphate synthase
MTNDLRIGHGYDLHRLQPGGTLWIGGVAVSHDLSAVAHSDGDVVLHAVVDALLGATAAGDIGERFPNTDEQWRNAPSIRFLDTVYADVKQAGWRVANLDVMILAERPKLTPHKQAMKEILARALEVPVDRVNVKAGTNEKVDAIGRGEAVAAHATVLLMR